VFSTYRKMLILFFAVQTFKELMMSLNTYSNWNYSNVDIDGFSYFLLGWYQKFYGGEQVRQHKASPNPSEVCTLGVDCGAARGRLESRKQSTPKVSAHASTLLKFALRTLVSSIPKVIVKNSKWKCMARSNFLWKCKRNYNECDNLTTRNNYSLHVQLSSSIMYENEPKVTVDQFIV
jgi:hypothetical protein